MSEATTTATAEQILGQVKRIAERDALASVDDIKTRLGWIKVSLNNAIEAIDCIAEFAILDGFTETDIRALHSLVESLATVAQEARPINYSAGRIKAVLNVLGTLG